MSTPAAEHPTTSTTLTPAPPIESPPPVYTPRAPPTVPFVVVEDPPPYSPKQVRDDGLRGGARRGEGRVCGFKKVNVVAILVLLVAAGVIAGGVYGYQHRGNNTTDTTDTADTTDTFLVPDPGADSVDGMGNIYFGTVGRSRR